MPYVVFEPSHDGFALISCFIQAILSKKNRDGTQPLVWDPKPLRGFPLHEATASAPFPSKQTMIQCALPSWTMLQGHVHDVQSVRVDLFQASKIRMIGSLGLANLVAALPKRRRPQSTSKSSLLRPVAVVAVDRCCCE